MDILNVFILGAGKMLSLLVGFIAAFAMGAAIGFFLKKTQEQKNAENGKLEEISRLIGELAHEIKNPLSTVKVNMKLLAEYLNDHSKESAQRAQRKITVIKKEIDRLEEILNSFLQYIDKTELNLARTDLNELVSDMVDFFTPQCYSNSINLRSRLHNEPLMCRIDPDMFKQVLLNLFINAQQSMPNGGELIIRTRRQDRSAIIEVNDTGQGMDKDMLMKIFKPYYSTRKGGSGLGLPKVKKIVEAHRGSIDVNSEPAKGTSFSITLPLMTENSD